MPRLSHTTLEMGVAILEMKEETPIEMRKRKKIIMSITNYQIAHKKHHLTEYFISETIKKNRNLLQAVAVAKASQIVELSGEVAHVSHLACYKPQ